MAYSALEKMRQTNRQRLGRDVGPLQPALADGAPHGFDLKSAALRFVHKRCEGLRFDSRIEDEETRTGVYRGTSLAPNQIPYNMQMDIDRLCLERELEKFIDSGSTRDAYNVYYCFAEMFLGGFGGSKRLLELLDEFESNASKILMEHRDHYSHSVYVFVLGLAIYETNESFRRTFNSFYHFDAGCDAHGRSPKAACFFLEFWGLTSLFHDIGYPFELTFEQMMSLFDVGYDRDGSIPYVIYKNARPMIEFDTRAQEHFERLYGRRFSTTNELLSYDITQKLGAAYGFGEDYLTDLLDKKPSSPEDFAYFMDHAYFSAIRLYRVLEDALFGDGEGTSESCAFQVAHVDALSAILLHYVVFAYSIAPCSTEAKTNLRKELHPLAWLLILCDELQCWDRTAYGRNTKTELHPMGVEFDFRNERITARFLFDSDEREKIDAWHARFEAWEAAGKVGSAPKLKAYSSIAGNDNGFADDIECLVDTTGAPLAISCATVPMRRGDKHVYLSDGSFSHVLDFAVALNARYSHEGHEDEIGEEELEAEFEALSLEYKLSNINQVKSFDRFLHEIRCFYTDRSVDFDMLREFTPEQIERIAPMEHERWVREHQSMGWRHDDIYEHAPVPQGVEERAYRKMLREQTRCHKLTMDGELTHEDIQRHYASLPEYDQGKDWLPFNSMLRLIERFDGLRIYQL